VEVAGPFQLLEPWKLIGPLLCKLPPLLCFLNNNLLIAQEVLTISDATEVSLHKLLNTSTITLDLILKQVILMKLKITTADLTLTLLEQPLKEVFTMLLSKKKMNFNKL